ncbi:MAG TPA: lysophospholipid acyltransferase family protein, partial [Candidatus Cloacimonadota bacterium]|nr:lysophospholipid acyltransferase family protein [Candidatus Cloacimonadota bacterium]
MKIYGKAATIVIRIILHLICKVDARELKKIPKQGPFIIAINHINFLEVPLLFTDLYPRPTHGIIKKETWDNSFLAWLADNWESISLDRESFSVETFKKAKEILRAGKIIIIAPEGTRSLDGKLVKAHPGVISMALQSDVPIIPVAHYGGEFFWDRISRFKRTNFTYKV